MQHQRWISGNIHYIRLHNANKSAPTLALKSRGDIIRTPKQGYQWSQNGTCECVLQNDFENNNDNNKLIKLLLKEAQTCEN